MQLHTEVRPDPDDIALLEAEIRREAAAATGLGDEVDPAIFTREAGQVVAGISGWTWGDYCELQSLWVTPRLRGRGLATQEEFPARTDVLWYRKRLHPTGYADGPSPGHARGLSRSSC